MDVFIFGACAVDIWRMGYGRYSGNLDVTTCHASTLEIQYFKYFQASCVKKDTRKESFVAVFK